MKTPITILGLTILTVFAFAGAVPATPRQHLATSVFSQVINPGWTSFTLPCNGVSLNATTFSEHLAGRDPGSTLLRVDSIGPFAFFLYQNLSYASIGQIWCLHGLALVNGAVAFSYYGSMTTRIVSPGNYTLIGQVLAGSGNSLSNLTRLSETWTTTTIV